jgi:hypothetical protein
VWPYEAAAVLQLSVTQVRVLVGVAALQHVGTTARLELDPDQVIALATEMAERGETSALGPYLARQLANGALVVARPHSAASAPLSPLQLLDQVIAVQSRSAQTLARTCA